MSDHDTNIAHHLRKEQHYAAWNRDEKHSNQGEADIWRSHSVTTFGDVVAKDAVLGGLGVLG